MIRLAVQPIQFQETDEYESKRTAKWDTSRGPCTIGCAASAWWTEQLETVFAVVCRYCINVYIIRRERHRCMCRRTWITAADHCQNHRTKKEMQYHVKIVNSWSSDRGCVSNMNGRFNCPVNGHETIIERSSWVEDVWTTWPQSAIKTLLIGCFQSVSIQFLFNWHAPHRCFMIDQPTKPKLFSYNNISFVNLSNGCLAAWIIVWPAQRWDDHFRIEFVLHEMQSQLARSLPNESFNSETTFDYHLNEGCRRDEANGLRSGPENGACKTCVYNPISRSSLLILPTALLREKVADRQIFSIPLLLLLLPLCVRY